MAFVVNRQGMACALYQWTEVIVRELEPIEHEIYEITQMERKSHGVDRIPDTDKRNGRIGRQTILLFEILNYWFLIALTQKKFCQFRPITEPVDFVGLADSRFQFVSRGQLPRIEDAAFTDEIGKCAYRKSPATEAKKKNTIAGIIDAYEFLIELFDVSTQTIASRSGEDLERSELLGSDTIVVNRDLGWQRWV